MTIDLESLPVPLQFAYVTMTRSAIYFKEIGQKKDFFLNFCDEIWNSMELTDSEYLKDVLSEIMEKDIDLHMDTYMKMSGELEDSNNPHPWAIFLNARWKAILWMRERMGYDDKQIAKNLSMDEMQVYLIRTSEHMPIPDGKNVE